MNRRNASRTNPIEPNLFPETSLTLLSLPNDLLLPIFEDVYEQRYGAEEIPASIRIADILVNKRIFALARPLWFSRLRLRRDRLEKQLVALLEDSNRLAHLQILSVPFLNAHAHLVGSSARRTVRRMVLDLRSQPPRRSQEENYYSEPQNFTRLFGLFARLELERFEGTSVERIAHFVEEVTVPSLRLLRLTGPCSFKDPTTFKNLVGLLDACPGLAQLHLVGSSFFGPDSSANAISQLESSKLGFWHPELAGLLLYLRTSSVRIFTYRGEGEQREVRWTRLTAEDEFDRDCWTL
ncbi:hypothetical protein JCM11491_007133 [Sporobolomyces phaffii]